ncbi:MAG: DUF2914 domain-containing protein [Deltaproteobacteria bacterium]|nr:DUF2914 domain-containing protein [Deltaproteobacteria bacterium]
MKTQFFVKLSVFLLSGIFFGCGNQVSEAAAEETDPGQTVSQDVAVKPPAAPAENTQDATAASPKPEPANADTQEMVIEEEEAGRAENDNEADETKPVTGDLAGTEDAQDGTLSDGSMTPELIDVEGVKLNSIILAKGVDKREPVEPGTQFTLADGEKIYAIMDVSNTTEDASELTVSWKMPNGDKEIGKTSLDVKAAKSWRTWAFTRYAKKSGIWEAIVRNAEGEVIARAPFEIVE